MNTCLPCEQRQMRCRLGEAMRRCPSGSFAVGAILNRAVRGLDAQNAFVALGIGDGFPLLAAISENPEKRCIGVDLLPADNPARNRRQRKNLLQQFDRLRSDLHTVHICDRHNDFSHFLDREIGVCFVGAGTTGSLLVRLKAAEPYLAENAFLLVESANESGAPDISLEFISSSSNQYRILLDRRTCHRGSQCFGSGCLLFQLLGRNAVANARPQPSQVRPAA